MFIPDYNNLHILNILEKNSTGHYWTFQLLDCQARHCNCEGCFCNDFMRQRGLQCQCKKILALLIKLNRKPSEKLVKLWKNQRGYINAE